MSTPIWYGSVGVLPAPQGVQRRGFLWWPVAVIRYLASRRGILAQGQRQAARGRRLAGPDDRFRRDPGRSRSAAMIEPAKPRWRA